MRAMILAAGLGTRMRPLTRLLAKPVLPVLNRPLLCWTIDCLRRAGIREIVVNLHHLPRSVRATLGDGRELGVRIRYSHERDEVLGTGGGPRRARRLLGEGPVLLVNGDMLFDFDLKPLLRDHLRSGARATLGVRAMPRGGSYGPIVKDSTGRVRWLPGVAGTPRGSKFLFTGIHAVQAELLDRLPAGPSDSVRHLYAPLIASGELLRAVSLEGAWYDLGRPALYLSSQLALLKGRFRGLGPDRLVHPTAVIEPGAEVQDAIVGANAVVASGACVRGSVLWDRVRVGAGSRVTGSILARGARVGPGERVRDRIRAAASAALLEEPGARRSGGQVEFELADE